MSYHFLTPLSSPSSFSIIVFISHCAGKTEVGLVHKTRVAYLCDKPERQLWPHTERSTQQISSRSQEHRGVSLCQFPAFNSNLLIG